MENSTVINNTSTLLDAPRRVYIYLTMSLIGIVINIIVLAVIIAKPLIPSKIARILLIHQCIICCVGSLFNVASLVSPLSYEVPENLMGDIICSIWYNGYLYWTTVLVSVDNTAIFAVERYLCLINPATHERLRMKHLIATLVGCWIIAFATRLPMATESIRVGKLCQLQPLDNTLKGVFGTALFIFYFFIPLITTFKLIRVLRQRSTNFYLHNQQQESCDQATRELSITVCIAATMSIALHLSNAISYYLYNVSLINSIVYNWLFALVNFFVNLNFLTNPLIYAVRLRSFPLCMETLFSRCCRSAPSQPQADETVGNRFLSE